ncbi:MAG TPA: 3-dehydroquinate synthase [Acidobacteriota bacterium]|nr:3-dehydroquinate synthase [Acidobacteriota bacterium]
MKTVHVDLGRRSYNILIGPGLLEQLPRLLEKYQINRRLFVIANNTVFALHGERLVRALNSGGFQATQILIPDGEKYKTLETLENIYTYLIAQGADRQSTIIALGGGVTGDVAGFVAATFYRGTPYIQLPTTLLAQVDSSIGGKTGVNHSLGKNLIGAFHQPSLVCADTDTLATLPQREFQSGMYEVLKYGLIYDADFFEYLEAHLEEMRSRRPGVIEEVIRRCCEIKAAVTSQDETEADLRRILNFGHTFGHGLEAAAGFGEISHGEAVGYGMIAAILLSERRGYLDEPTAERLIRAICRIGPLPPISSLSLNEVLDAMRRDKKRRHDRLHFVLLKEIGKTVIESDLDQVTLAEIWARISDCGRRSAD